MLNIGIIGPGRVAERHANALKEIDNAQLWSVGGRSIDTVKAFAQKHITLAKKNTFDDIHEMLVDPNLDAVIIATPDKLHAEHILLAADAGKVILVEKPLCTSRESCQELLNKQKQLSMQLAVAYHLRWHSGLRLLAKKIHAKECGNVRHMRLHWAVNFMDHVKWRTEIQYSQWLCLTVLGTHLIDLMRWMMIPICGEVVELKSIVNHSMPNYFDETILASFHFESGDTAEIFCSVLFDSPFQLEIYGDQKNVIGVDLAGQNENRKIFINQEPLIFEHRNPYIDQLNDFISAVLEKSEPEVTLQEGLSNVEHLISIWQPKR